VAYFVGGCSIIPIHELAVCVAAEDGAGSACEVGKSDLEFVELVSVFVD